MVGKVYSSHVDQLKPKENDESFRYNFKEKFERQYNTKTKETIKSHLHNIGNLNANPEGKAGQKNTMVEWRVG